MATQVTRIQTQLPTALVAEMEALIAAGWFRDRDTLLADALRRYLESHRPQRLERLEHEDVEWGQRGRE